LAVGFSAGEVHAALRWLQSGKAPGLDCILAEMLKRAYEVLPGVFEGLSSNCLRQGIFPKSSKIAEVRPILKDPTRDPRDMGFLQPVSLLNCMGKWLEDLMMTRLGVDIEAGDWLDDRQFSFCAGRGAEDDVNRLIDGTGAIPGRYVMGLFLDIIGAFNGARWSDMLERINAISGCRHLVRLFEDYFADRHTQMMLNWGSFRKGLDRGCPQGSKVGPLGWILLFDSFLHLPWPSCVQAMAYADDAALIIGADTRKELEETAGVCCTLIENWGAQHALVFNAQKTEAITLRLPRGTDLDKYCTPSQVGWPVRQVQKSC